MTQATSTNAPFTAELVDRMGLLRQEPVHVRFWRRILCTLKRDRLSGRNWAADEVSFFLWVTFEGRLGQPEILGQQRFRCGAKPIRDAESAEFGKVAVVKNQNEI